MPDTNSSRNWPGLTEECFPEVFTQIPPQLEEKKLGQLTDDQLKQYFEEGYVLLEDFFSREELDPCREAIKILVDDLANKLHNAGKISKLHRDSGLFERLTLIEKEFPGTNIILHKQGILPQAFRDLWANERILNVIEQLIGPEIAASPMWNLRPKTPKSEATVVPWHQDSAYFDDASYSTHIPAAWIPFLDANETNGCMQVAKFGHRKGQIALHQCCAGPTWYIMLEEEEMKKTLGVNLKEDILTCPVPYGGLLLFSNILPHRSLPNVSNDIRWSVDLRWSNPEKPYGLFGLKDGTVLRSAKNPNLKPDWETFCSVDRTKMQNKSVNKEEDEFETTLSGPWMKRWEIVHHNHHTASLEDDK